MSSVIEIQPLTAEDFAAFGDVLTADGDVFKSINKGLCRRYHDLAALEFDGGSAGISLFKSEVRTLPYELDLVERHPQGTQAFIPMSHHPFLVVVAKDNDGTPAQPQAFVTKPGQAINLHRGVWHGVLTPLYEPGLFAVVDRIGDGANLEEYEFISPYLIQKG